MTKDVFIASLDERLDFLSNREKNAVLKKYRTLINSASDLGLDEQSFITGLGNIEELIVRIQDEHLGKKQSNQLIIQNTLQKVVIYVLAGAISLGVFALLFASFSFGLSWFIFGINRLTTVTADTSGASYALYIGQMVFGIGLWIFLIGLIIKVKPFIKNIAKKLETLFDKSAKDDLSHE